MSQPNLPPPCVDAPLKVDLLYFMFGIIYTLTQEPNKINKISLKNTETKIHEKEFLTLQSFWHVLSLWDYKDDKLDSLNPISGFGQKPRTPTWKIPKMNRLINKRS